MNNPFKKSSPRFPSVQLNDIRGINQLAMDAVAGVTDMTEALHLAILCLGLNDKNIKPKTTGITGFVYSTVRLITNSVGNQVDSALAKLDSQYTSQETSFNREVAISTLNGILGDHLVFNNNPLAIIMQLRRDGKPLSDEQIQKLIETSNGKILLMVHGLCMNDLQWQVEKHDHGIELARELGYEPIYLHYNTGRHISENGHDLSELLTYLAQLSTTPLNLAIVAHSMGGLVTRSAFHHAEKAKLAWLAQVNKAVFLGTPHHGAVLEKGGNIIDVLIKSTPYSLPFAQLAMVRSAGITDLRYGSIKETDWQGKDRFKYSADVRGSLTLPTSVRCFTIAAVKSEQSNLINDGLIGDGLVNVNSALGRHNNALLDLAFPDSHQWVGRNMNHMDLLHHTEVYRKIKQWLA